MNEPPTRRKAAEGAVDELTELMTGMTGHQHKNARYPRGVSRPRRAAFKISGMSNNELKDAYEAALEKLDAHKTRALERMSEVIKNEGGYTSYFPTNDPRYKQLNRQLEADFKKNAADLEKKYKVRRRPRIIQDDDEDDD